MSSLQTNQLIAQLATTAIDPWQICYYTQIRKQKWVAKQWVVAELLETQWKRIYIN